MRGLAARPLFWVCVVVLCLGIDALFIEPYRLQVTHYEVRGAVGTPLKIAQLSDLHTHGVGRLERKVLAALDAEKPDVIFITGDSIASYGGTYQEVKEVYERLHAPLGVWFVRGNWENDKPPRHEKAFYQEVGVHFLLNANAELRPDVWVIGLNDPSSGPVHLDTALAGIPDGAYKVALFHAPAFFDKIAARVNLVLAGHTHGGQVRIPFVYPFWLPKGSGRFLEGWYQDGATKMYVNRGLGMSILPVRFLCPPEVAIIRVHP